MDGDDDANVNDRSVLSSIVVPEMSAEKRKKKEKKEKKDKKKKKKEKRHRKSESSAEDDVIVDSGVASKRHVVAKKNKSVQVRWLLLKEISEI